MKFKVKVGDVLSEPVDALIVGICEKGRELSPIAQEINRRLGGVIDRVLKRKGFTGKSEQVEVINSGGVIPAAYIFLCGLGKEEKIGPEQIRQAIGKVSLRARDMGLKTLATTTSVYSYKSGGISSDEVARAIAEGSGLAVYKFSKYKVKENNNAKYIDEFRLVEDSRIKAAEVEKGLSAGRIISESVNFARDLINHPANDMTPAILADTAKKMAKGNRIRCTILSTPGIKQLGMGAFLGVAKGSQEPPKFIILEYKGGKRGEKQIVVVGRTIEIISTDAEGRLALADALFYATRYKPKCILDIATLTGACAIALGNHAIGMLGNDKALKERMEKAAEYVWERVWEMPLWDDYFEQIKSPVADMKNSGGREGGVMTAAIFLSKFIEDYPWVHLDIASVEWNDKERPYIPVGGTAIGARLLIQFLMDFSKG